ncbi:nucleophosmin-like [Sorex araneus]|uniref:nucleophosmin-like n=1 Tax=Sorex araneus TaxID=42254 RepID=UPI002433FD75|nr:nucleophosmin-like [Sorex araneus]
MDEGAKPGLPCTTWDSPRDPQELSGISLMIFTSSRKESIVHVRCNDNNKNSGIDICRMTARREFRRASKPTWVTETEKFKIAEEMLEILWQLLLFRRKRYCQADMEESCGHAGQVLQFWVVMLAMRGHHPVENLLDVDMNPWRPQNYLYGYELKAGKDYNFKADNDENKHQPSLRTVSLGAGAKDELHVVEAEATNYEGQRIKATLATLKRSMQPTVSLGAFEIRPPLVLRLKCGSGPVHVSGQHLVPVEEDAESEDDKDDDVRLLGTSGKRSAPTSGSKVPQKKVKLAADEDTDDDEDDGDNASDEGEDDEGRDDDSYDADEGGEGGY